MKLNRFPLLLASGLLVLAPVAAAPVTAARVAAAPAQPAPTPLPLPTPTPPPPPPRAQAYVRARPGAKTVGGRTMVPVTFLQSALGAAIQTIRPNRRWKISYFQHEVEVVAGERNARINGNAQMLPVAPRAIGGHLYVPWVPLAELFDIRWSRPTTKAASDGSTLFLLQYQAAYIDAIRHSVSNDKIRVVYDLSNTTRVTARYTPEGVKLQLAAARRPGISNALRIGDYLVPRVVTNSGNWRADSEVRLNYAAPASWFTTGNPPRIVVDVQRLFEKRETQNISGGLTLTKIFRGTGHGPVRLFVARVDPARGWRIHVAPGGYSVLQRQRPSRIARGRKAVMAINGGFFAFDGAAVGALRVNGEWLRLPWKGRTVIAFKPNGAAKIGNLQAKAEISFSSGLKLPIRDLNGWPDRNRISLITRHFRTQHKLRAGEMAMIVEKGIVTSTPGSGTVSIPKDGFVLIANGGAKPELQKARRGLRASFAISAPGWDDFPSILGGGPRLVSGGKADVKEEGFRSDVTRGLAPRTAMGIDKNGRFLLLVADGRQGYYSTGLTLPELAQTLQKHGAVNALNLDGGGSTAMVVKGRVINRPSDGSERRVSNALLVAR